MTSSAPESHVSVVIPAYQAEATIAESLDSVFSQTRPADEVIVVDDGSTDATAAIVRGEFPRAILIQQSHRGGGAALNLGIKSARGDMLAFNDSDDLWTPRRLELQLEALRSDPLLDGVGGLSKSFLCSSVPAAEAHRFIVPEEPQASLLGTALLVRRPAFERVGGLAEDLTVSFSVDWNHRAMQAGLRLASLPEIVLLRRVRMNSLSGRGRQRDLGYLEMARRAIERRRMRGDTP